MTTRGFEFAGLAGGTVVLGSTPLEQLSAQLHGVLIGPGDDGWVEAITIWNGMVTKKPTLVVQPESAQDVAVAVRFARDHGLLLSVKGGGHNIGGTAIADRGLMLDMSRMGGVRVDPDRRLADIGPGCRLRDVDAATQEHGLATTLGFISKVGVAGLTLGGGFGYLARRFGWTVDNLEEVEIVSADGRILVANQEEHPDLYWALRGGGGNFGVVTRFTLRLHELGPTVVGGLIAWDAARADEVLGVYREATASAPRELTLAAAVRLAPPAPFVPEAWRMKPIVAWLVCYSGADPATALAPMRSLGDPVLDLVGEHPYTAQQSMMDDSDPDGANQYWKAEYVSGLSTDYLDVFRDAALAQTSPLSYSVIFHIGGALNDRESDDGAVGNRDAGFVTGFSGVWPREDLRTPQHVEWVRAGWERIRPFSTGGNYVNFQLAEDDGHRTAEAYGKNLERLRAVKAAYDPTNLFRVNRNISPAA